MRSGKINGQSLVFGLFLAFGPGWMAPVAAQEGVGMKNLLMKLGVIPDEDAEVPTYRERPGLVLPKDLNKLPKPEENNARASAQWPVDPDVVAREKARKAREFQVFIPTAANSRDPNEGGTLSLKDMAAGRSKKGAQMGEKTYNYGDKPHMLSPEEMKQTGQMASEPSYPPGTEPPRRYLTDPPVGSRLPSKNAAIGKRTMDAPYNDNAFNRPQFEKLE